MPITFSLQSSKIPEITFSHDIKNSVDKRSIIVSKTWGQLSLDEIWFNGIGICYWKFDVQQPYLVNIESDEIECIKGFVLSGNAMLNTAEHLATIDNGVYYSCYGPVIAHQLTFQRPANLLMVYFEKPAIERLCSESLQNKPAIFAEGLTVGEFHSIAIEQILNEITKAIEANPVKRIYLEEKLLELLSLQLEQHSGIDEEKHGLNETDIQRLHEARFIVSQNLQTPCSLIELARKTGLNDFKLKKGFKALFGTTVFGHLNDLRMDKAYTLLKTNASVGYVAEVIGYKNAQHFTVAFKKKFGVLPSQVSKNLA